jgi:hypothetical protein
MSMLQQTNKGPYMNTLEQFYIQQFAYNKRLIPEQNMGTPTQYSALSMIFKNVTPPRDSDLLKYRLHHLIASTILTIQ